MVLFLLYMKAELEGVASVALRRSDDDDGRSRTIRLHLRNPLSDYEIRENVSVHLTECVEQEQGSREPPHHLSLKWEGSKKASNADGTVGRRNQNGPEKEGQKGQQEQ